MSRLLDFYRGKAGDDRGRMLRHIWAWDDDDLEAVHDFIQWLFPLPEPSAFNPRAPLLTDEDIQSFRADPRLQANLRRSHERFLSFLGLAQAPDGQVIEAGQFAERVPEVWSAPNHNWLRITRLLRSLSLLGLEREASALFDHLDGLYRAAPISDLGGDFPVLDRGQGGEIDGFEVGQSFLEPEAPARIFEFLAGASGSEA